MKRVLSLALALAALCAAAGMLVMTVMAGCYLEWGRVLLYGFLLVISLEVLAFGLYKFLKTGKE